MIRRVVRSTIAGTAIASVLAGCSDASGPDAVAGTYHLQRYEGQSLPAFFVPTATGSISVVDEHLLLGDDGRGVATTVYEENPGGRRIPITRGLDYDVRGQRVEITFDCVTPSSSSMTPACAVGPHLTGERVGGGLALGRPVSSKPASTYQRVR